MAAEDHRAELAARLREYGFEDEAKEAEGMVVGGQSLERLAEFHGLAEPKQPPLLRRIGIQVLVWVGILGGFFLVTGIVFNLGRELLDPGSTGDTYLFYDTKNGFWWGALMGVLVSSAIWWVHLDGRNRADEKRRRDDASGEYWADLERRERERDDAADAVNAAALDDAEDDADETLESLTRRYGEPNT